MKTGAVSVADTWRTTVRAIYSINSRLLHPAGRARLFIHHETHASRRKSRTSEWNFVRALHRDDVNIWTRLSILRKIYLRGRRQWIAAKHTSSLFRTPRDPPPHVIIRRITTNWHANYRFDELSIIKSLPLLLSSQAHIHFSDLSNLPATHGAINFHAFYTRFELAISRFFSFLFSLARPSCYTLPTRVSDEAPPNCTQIFNVACNWPDDKLYIFISRARSILEALNLSAKTHRNEAIKKISQNENKFDLEL